MCKEHFPTWAGAMYFPWKLIFKDGKSHNYEELNKTLKLINVTKCSFYKQKNPRLPLI